MRFGACLALLLLAGCPAPAPAPPRGADAGTPSEAELAAQLASRLNDLPADLGLLESAARLLLEQGRFPEAVEAARRALAIDPARCDLHHLRAQAFLAMEDDGAATECLRACLAARPDDPEALFQLGGLLAARHPDEPDSVRETLVHWERLLQVTPDTPRAPMVRRALPGLRQRLGKELESESADKKVNSP